MQVSRGIAAAAIALAALVLAACGSTPPPPAPPAPPPAPPPIVGPQSISERTLLTMASDQTFPPGGFALKKAAKAKLDKLVPALQAQPGAKIVVYGYTDNKPVGKELKKKGIVDNLDLSSKRANEVVRYLIARGINPNIISAKGRGDTHPVAANTTLKGRAQNRRIEVVIEQPTG